MVAAARCALRRTGGVSVGSCRPGGGWSEFEGRRCSRRRLLLTFRSQVDRVLVGSFGWLRPLPCASEAGPAIKLACVELGRCNKEREIPPETLPGSLFQTKVTAWIHMTMANRPRMEVGEAHYWRTVGMPV